MPKTSRQLPAFLILILFALLTGTAAGQTTDDFFSDAVLHDIRLHVHPADWAALQANFQENTYYPCVFEWNGVVAEGGGIRSRGRGSRNGTKPGLRVDFDRYEKDQEFLGLHSVVLDNLAQDPTLLRDRISMLMYRQMGVPAPRMSQARLYVNNTYQGLYAVVESVDKRFLRRNFNEDDGFLYEYDWVAPYYFEYEGPNPSSYSPVPFKPVTHETDPEPAPIEAWIRTANQSSEEEFAEAMVEFIDLPAFADLMAVEVFSSEYDGIAGYFGMNNFYLYRFEGSNRFQFIPWDRDLSFTQTVRGIWQDMDKNVLTAKAFRSADILARFIAAIRRTVARAGGPGGWLEQEAERAYLQIRAAVYDDTRKLYLGDQGLLVPLSNAEFDRAFQNLRQFIRDRPAFVLAQLPPPPVASVRRRP